MIRGRTDTGSIFIGIDRGEPLARRLAAGERVFLERTVGSDGVAHPALWLDFSGGPRAFARLLAGERVCVPPVVDEAGALVVPHVCLFVREGPAALLAALDELFPGGLLPGAPLDFEPSRGYR